jgi:hypothetical protein
MEPAFVSILPLFIIGCIVVVIALASLIKPKPEKKRYQFTDYQKYSTSYSTTGLGTQFEFDMRQPYRRFKRLYPRNKWTYEEYKQMQMQKAYRRSNGSEKNKRMVR